MTQFKPSSASRTPKGQALQSLSYAKRAIERLEKYLERVGDDDVPLWVLTKINQAASCFGQAVSFVKFKAAKEEKK